MLPTVWTYESLAQVDRPTLERVLLEGTAPDMDQLNGYIYCGWNHEWVGHLSGKKFKKGFWQKDGKNVGYNEIVVQDYKEYRGNWNVLKIGGRPLQVGYFRTSMIKDEPPQPLYKPYEHSGHFNYNVPLNTGLNVFFRMIRDFVVLPNPGDHSLMLCKAYFQFGTSINLFYCYFLLGHPQEIEFKPWWAA
jgi:hypothetical protein